jgi:prepilin-type processing-associated H-X9-DG protein
MKRIPHASRGLSLPEVVVVLAILMLLAMAVMIALPRMRENARMVGCQRSLMQIGMALALYNKSEKALPTVPPLKDVGPAAQGPLRALLETLALPDFHGLGDATRPPERRKSDVPGERPVPGFTCGSDPEASAGRFPAPTSYRACAGNDVAGTNGGFAPGQKRSLAEIEAGDGRSYTAAFSERLLGSGRDGDPRPSNYRQTPGTTWKGDAGRSWTEASWRSTLYNHVLTPNSGPSSITEDGTTAEMGASSGHVRGVNVLMFDGSVRTFTPNVNAEVWKVLATPDSPRGPVGNSLLPSDAR